MRLWPEVEERASQRHPNQEIDGNISTYLGTTRDEVATMLGGAVSGKLIEQGKAVAERAPELWKDVQRGGPLESEDANVPSNDGDQEGNTSLLIDERSSALLKSSKPAQMAGLACCL